MRTFTTKMVLGALLLLSAASVTTGLRGEDCNYNGRADPCDILSGDSQDQNGDGVPDECRMVYSLVPKATTDPEAIIDGKIVPAAVNIGIAPTIRQEDVTIEAHLLDFSADITGSEIEIVFHQRIRPEKKFESQAALKDQIGLDVESVRAYFGSNIN